MIIKSCGSAVACTSSFLTRLFNVCDAEQLFYAIDRIADQRLLFCP